MTAGPRLSIGMPVYDGKNYDGKNFVAETLHAQLARNGQEGRAS